AAVAQMWKSTPSGFVLADSNVHLTSARAAPKVPGATVVSIGGARNDDGAHVLRGRTMTSEELGAAIVHQLTAPGAEPLPRKLVVHGDDSDAVALAISRGLPNVDVIGTLGSVGSLKSGLTMAGTVSALGHRFLLQRDTGPRWVGYLGGNPISIP